MNKTRVAILGAGLMFAGSGTPACDIAPSPRPVQRVAGSAKAVHFSSGMVTLTFDDGWIGQADYAAPLLEERGWRGTFYLVPQWFGRHRDGEAFMSVEQARQLPLAGHEIGDHTMTHKHLPTLSSAGIRGQMVECKRFLADKLGIAPEAITSFASPLGDYDDIVLDHAHSLFSSHRTTDPHLN